jgi:hypothetical protein
MSALIEREPFAQQIVPNHASQQKSVHKKLHQYSVISDDVHE